MLQPLSGVMSAATGAKHTPDTVPGATGNQMYLS